MGSKRAFVHIGLAKTGTKSIQFALAQRRSKLRRAGWIFPKEGTTTNRSGHHGLAWHLQGAKHQHPGLLGFDPVSFKTAVEAAKDQHVIISSEDLSALSTKRDAILSLLTCFPQHE